MRTQLHKEALYLVLKQDNKNYEAYSHELIHNGADKPHAENLGGKHPHHNEGEDSIKDIDSTRLFHKPVDVEEHHCEQQDIYHVFYSEIKHLSILLFIGWKSQSSIFRRAPRSGVRLSRRAHGVPTHRGRVHRRRARR